MTSQSELEYMIRCFRVVDLQILLSFAGRSRLGKKLELQERALELLQLNSQPVALKVKSLYEAMHSAKISKPDSCENASIDTLLPSTTERDDGGGLLTNEDKEASDKSPGEEISLVDDTEDLLKTSILAKTLTSANTGKDKACSAQPSPTVQLSFSSLYMPIHPDVKFKTLPFYSILSELLRPRSLVPQNYDFQQKSSFAFYITPQQVAAISHSVERRPGLQDEYKVQGQLRFCLLETTSQQNDCFPPGLVVRVNNKFCYIQESPVKKKKDVYVREISPPINITPYMKLNASQKNKIEVQWNTEFGVAYVAGVYLVQRKTSEDLLNHLKAKGVRSADYTKGMIKDKLSEEADGEILTTSLRVSLMCPLGKMRLKTPCRASTCQHLQCFDASLYIQMNERKATWMCPVCDCPAEYDQLVIDGYFQEILSSEKLPANVNEIEFYNDGSWACHAYKPDVPASTSSFVKVETEDIVDVIIDDSKCDGPSDAGNVSSNESRTGLESEKRKIDEIDLTVSDSDDEPLIYYKKRESSKNKRSGIFQPSSNSNSNSNRSSPSIINLDSDSSDSIPLMIPTQYPVLPSL